MDKDIEKWEEEIKTLLVGYSIGLISLLWAFDITYTLKLLAELPK